MQLWLGRNAHLVHYPVKSGTLINIVAIVTDHWAEPGWSAEGAREELLAHYSAVALGGAGARIPGGAGAAGTNGRSTTCRRSTAGATGR